MWRKTVSLLLCIVLVSGLIGCTAAPAEAQPPSTTVPPATEHSPANLYSEARRPVDEAVNLKLLLTTEKVMTVGIETFSSLQVQDISMTDIGTDNLKVKLTEELDLNDQFARTSEYYANGTMYTSVLGSHHFTGSISQEDYLARFMPPVLLDSALYSTVESSTEGENTRITFSDPSAAETWAMPEGAEMLRAQGSALISPEGTLMETTYTIAYNHGATQVEMTVTAVAEVRQAIPMVGLSPSIKYQEVSDPTIPKLHTLAQMYLYASNFVSSVSHETVYCEAIDFAYVQQIAVDIHNPGENAICSSAYQVVLQQGDYTASYTQGEHYSNETLTITDEEGNQETIGYPVDIIVPHFRSYLTENIPTLDYITSFDVADMGGILYLEMLCTEEYGNSLNNYICSMIFGDTGYLNASASDYETLECFTYLAIDKYTGFPTSTGIYYNGIHTIEGYEYFLGLHESQSFSLASSSAYEAITGESAPEEEPDQKATPLFYHVTGQEGQEMWLIGTIHVGDERTAYLPQEIYDALESSDALAVEFDSFAFEEALESDMQLAEAVTSSYYYSDGTLTQEHLDDMTYTAGLLMLRASGNYRPEIEYAKPFLWSQAIDDLFLRQSYSLVSWKGVDARLLDLAREMDMEILDIESGLFQAQMLSGFSDELQAMLLQQSLATDIAIYREDLMDLYEKWCSGDEAILQEAVSTEIDTSQMTDEELELYENTRYLMDEYNKVILFDRNERMLDVAIEYLESGRTIFYAVGLAHLLNDVNGLVDTLRDAGYTVELVNYAG